MNNAIIVPILSLCIGAGVAMADAPVPSTDKAAVNAVKQAEEEMGYAMIQRDIGKLSEFYADDFATISSSGKIITKQDVLNDFETSRDRLEAFESGPIDVQVFGNHAVAHAAVKEKRMRDGKDVSGEFVWSDLLENRGGKWVVVRSAGARVK